MVQEHNAHADKWGWTLEMNALADMESSEFAAKYNGFGQSEKRDDTHNHVPGGGSLLGLTLGGSLPSTVDWTTKGAVTPVKNQK